MPRFKGYDADDADYGVEVTEFADHQHDRRDRRERRQRKGYDSRVEETPKFIPRVPVTAGARWR